MRCPKDADFNNTHITSPLICCNAVSYGWQCTRPRGHKGRHHAHALKKCFWIWGDE